MSDAGQITYSKEIARKGIHFSSLLIPIIYLQIDRPKALLILAPMALAAIVIDVLIQRHSATRRVMMRLVGDLMRSHELQRSKIQLNGASWVLISAFATVAVFPKVIAVTAFSILIVSDSFAALIGRRFGRRRFLDKSVAGTIAFVISAIACVLVYAACFSLPWTFVVAGVLGSIVGGVIESASIRLRVDDNLSIPFATALVMWLLSYVFALYSLPAFAGALP